MNLTEFTINRNRISIGLFLIVAALGFSTYLSLPQDSMPAFTIRVATIVTTFPGAGPERVEELVTENIEQKVQEIPEVDEITSTSRSNVSVIKVVLRDDVEPGELQPIWDRIRRKMNDVTLPENATWELKDDGIGEVFGIILGLTTEVDSLGNYDFSYAEMKDIADDIRDDLIAIEDAAKVEIAGDQEEKIFVEFDNAKLANYGISAAQIQSILSSTNILFSGGSINVSSERLVLEPTGNFEDIESLKRTIIRSEGGKNLYLSDIASVTRGYESPKTQIIKVDNKPAISLAISLKKGANIVRLGNVIDQKVEQYNQTLPYGLKIKRLSSLDKYVDGEVSNFVSNLLQTIVLVLLVMLVFLGVRTGLIIASLVPMVVLATFVFMGVLGEGINQVTLAALIMALGMMVDNGVVVSETVLVKLEEGKTKIQAVVEACNELIIPLLISTLTTSVAFLSFYLAESTMGDIVGPLFVVISIALIASWLLSMTLITMLCFYFIKVGKKTEPSFVDKVILYLREKYEVLIDACLKRKALTLSSIIGLFLFSLYLFQFIPFIFFPDSERNLVTIDINLPQGTKIEETQEVVENIEAYITANLLVQSEEDHGIVDWSAFVGEGPDSYDLGYQPDEPNSNYAHLLVNTTSGDDNALVIARLDSFCFETFPTADIKISRLKGGGGGTPIEIKISGENPDIITAIAEKVKSKLATTSGTKNVKDNWGPKSKKIIVDIDPLKAQNAGLSNQDIALSLYTALDGFKTGDFREGEKSIAIVMRNENYDQLKIDQLGSLSIFSQSTGKNVPLSQVADIHIDWQYAKIGRENLRRSVNVSSEISEDGNTSVIMGQVIPWLDEEAMNWPKGYRYELGGDSENSSKNMGSIAKWLPLSAVLIVLLLIIQFNSVRKTAIVLTTIPLGIIGVVLGLLLLNSYFGFFAFLGIISLAGIVINNAIVLIDRIEVELEAGLKLRDALVQACLGRFRPILLTTFTTVLGMIPLYLGGGLMWEPMAAAIMIGLLFGTMITLVFVPVLYSLLYRKQYEKLGQV